MSDLEIHGMEKGDSILWMEKIKKCGFTLDVSGANFAPTWKSGTKRWCVAITGFD
ncbi:hypothetical protein [Ralstonia pseudosolanacearum]|uniref:hypothetical protein n=1 Tax=Ralstonia pseudosolanacearum TaxID=1310165 RepID=UPI0012FD6B2D